MSVKWDEIQPELERYANWTLSHYPKMRVSFAAEDLVQTAFERMMPKLESGEISSPIAFGRRVIANLVLDGARAMGRTQRPSEEDYRNHVSGKIPRLGDDPQPRAVERWTARSTAMRDALDSVAWDKTHQVDYFAALLLILRLELLKQAVAALSDSESPERILRTVETVLTFRASEEHRALRVGWPPVGDLWRRIGPILAARPSFGDGEVCECISEFLGGSGEVRRDTWYQWKCRAKRRAQDRIDADAWNRSFAHLLRDNA